MYEDPRSKISQLEKILNAREDLLSKREKRHSLSPHDSTVNQDWDNSEFKVGGEVFTPTIKPKGLPFSTKILIGSIIFFIIAFGIVAYKFLWGGNLVSGNNIEVTVKAPISVTGGEVVPFEIEIKNNNNVSLLGADLGVTFPLGAKEVSNTALPAKRVQEFLGDILPGQSVKKNLSVVLFGGENEKKDININLEYKVAGSNSSFNKTKIFSVLISSSPVSIMVTGPTEVNTNQSVNFTVDIVSNSPTVMKNLLLKAEYPFGFSFSQSNPKTFLQNNIWFLGDLESGGKRKIVLTGILSGQEGEERSLNFNLGSTASADNPVISVLFVSSFSMVTIRRPFVSADIFFNDSSDKEYVSQAGSKVETVIKWQNNLAYEVSDVSLTVKMSGNDFDKNSVSVGDGYYRSVDNTIIFNKTTDKALANLSPGDSGESKFSFSSFGLGTVVGSNLNNPSIILDISVKGQKLGDQGQLEDILFSDSRKIKITADPQFLSKALYYVGPFKNIGPIPPKAEQKTTYTITWTVTNPLNNLSGAVVSAILPPYIKWLGAVSPSSEKIDYDEGTGLVTWNVGGILAGAGSVSPAKEVSFQISFTPSVNQIGENPTLAGEVTLNARDSFTLTPVASSFSSLDTSLSNDPYFKVDGEKVSP